MSSNSGRRRDKAKGKALNTSTGEDAALDNIARRVSKTAVLGSFYKFPLQLFLF